MARANTATAEGLSLLAPYWSSIVSERANGNTPQNTWGVLTELFQEGGPSFQGATIFDMNAMWGRAGQLLNAEAAFGAEPAANPVNGDMWAWAPWAAPTTEAWQTPNYMINYSQYAADAEGNVLLDTEGNPLQIWGATDWQGSLDVTKQTVLDRVQESALSSLDIGSPGIAAQMSAAGATSFGGIASVQIMRF